MAGEKTPSLFIKADFQTILKRSPQTVTQSEDTAATEPQDIMIAGWNDTIAIDRLIKYKRS